MRKSILTGFNKKRGMLSHASFFMVDLGVGFWNQFAREIEYLSMILRDD